MRRKFKGIYLITIETPETVYRYVGQSINIMKRKENHISRLRTGKHDNSLLQRAFNKYGESFYKFQALEELPDTITAEELTEKEEYYCQLFQTYIWDSRSGCNLREAEKSGKISDETREKMSNNAKKLCENPEHREKISRNLKKLCENPEHREKISRNLKKLWEDPEYREKMSRNLGKLWEDPEYREKIFQANKEYWDKPENRETFRERVKKQWQDPEYKERVGKAISKRMSTDEYKERLSQTTKERWDNPEYKERVSAAIKAGCLESKEKRIESSLKARGLSFKVKDPSGNVKEYLGILALAKEVGASRTNTSYFVNGKLKESRLFAGWEVVNDSN